MIFVCKEKTMQQCHKKSPRLNFVLDIPDGFSHLYCYVIRMAQMDKPLAPSKMIFIFPILIFTKDNGGRNQLFHSRRFILKPQNNGLQNYNYSFTKSILTSPLLLDTFSVFSPPSLLSGRLLSPFFISD